MLEYETGQVDCSNVVLSNGRSLVQRGLRCSLCGQTGGLKLKCAHDDCCYLIDGERVDTLFHVTCARQAGLEVNAVEGQHTRFYGKSNFRLFCWFVCLQGASCDLSN